MKNDSVDNSIGTEQDTDFTDEEAKTPKLIRQEITRTISGFISGHISNPLFEKLSSDHISELIKMQSTDDEHQHSLEIKKQNSIRFYVVVFVIVFIFLIVYLSAKNSDLLIEILKTIGLLGAGFLGGYGIGKTRK